MKKAFLIVASLLSFQACLEAATPSDLLLPATTKGYLSITDAKNLTKKWQEMQLGQLSEDPIMKPFVDDFKEQLRSKLGQTGAHLGIGLDDLEGIPNGEISIALIQPANDKKQHALVLKVDVTGQEAEARELLARVTANQVQKGAQKSSVTVQGLEITTLKFPKKDDVEERRAYYLLHEDQFLVVNHLETLKELIGRFDGKAEDSLRSLKPFAVTMERTQGDGATAAEIRWFVDPFGYVEVTRSMAGACCFTTVASGHSVTIHAANTGHAGSMCTVHANDSVMLATLTNTGDTSSTFCIRSGRKMESAVCARLMKTRIHNVRPTVVRIESGLDG